MRGALPLRYPAGLLEGSPTPTPPNEMRLSQNLQRALDQLRNKREPVDRDREDARGASGDVSKNEDGTLLVPESKARAYVRV